jgi:hypothetical protein
MPKRMLGYRPMDEDAWEDLWKDYKTGRNRSVKAWLVMDDAADEDERQPSSSSG